MLGDHTNLGTQIHVQNMFNNDNHVITYYFNTLLGLNDIKVNIYILIIINIIIIRHKILQGIIFIFKTNY